MTVRMWPVDAVNGFPKYSGRALRQLLSPFLGGASTADPLGARSGVRPGTPASTVTVTSTTWTVGRHAGVLDVQPAVEAGPYTYAIDAAVSGQLNAADASNPRTDIVYVQLTDAAEGNADENTPPSVTFGYLPGTPTAVPGGGLPLLPPRSMRLARINMPKAGGGSPSVTWDAPNSVSAGGILPVDTLANLRNIPGTGGMHAVVTSDPSPLLNGTYKWNSADSVWQPISLPQNLMQWVPGSYARVPNVFPIMQMGQAQGQTSGTGRLVHRFPTAFPNGISGVILMPHQNSGYAAGALPVLVEDSLTATGFDTFWGGRASSGVYIPYLAIGY